MPPSSSSSGRRWWQRAPAICLDPSGFNELRECRFGPMLYNRNDAYVGASLRKYGEHSYLEHELVSHLVRSGDLVVEAGANIGAHTVGLSRLAGAKGAVLAFEPQRVVFQTLCANLALNQCKNVYALQQALGERDEEVLVPAPEPATEGNFGGVSLFGVTHGERVPMRRLDALQLPACHFIKADVEGMEVELLHGARETIAKYRPVMYVENDRESRSGELIGLLLGMGYELYWHLPPLFNRDNFARERENIFPNIVSINMLCLPAGAAPPVSDLRRITSPQDSWK